MLKKRSGWVIQALILSALLNVVLVGLFFSFLVWDTPLPMSFQPWEPLSQEENSEKTKEIFLLLEKQGIEHSDPQLLTYFCHTEEFVLLRTLFARLALPIQPSTLLAMSLEGGWERLEKFVQAQRLQSNFSDQMRRALLMDYIETKSITAAYLLIITDPFFAAHELEVPHVDLILDALSIKTQEALAFVKTIAASYPEEALRKKAAQRLINYGEDEIAARFTPRPSEGKLAPPFRDQPPISVEPSQHLIQPGESLWTIANKYHVSIEKLMEANHLTTSVIRQGRLLKIPRD